MSLYILDTDHVTLHQHKHPRLITQIRHHIMDEIATTIVTVEEQMRGRLAQQQFRQLRLQKIRIGTLDLRIAAIVLRQNAILFTRNRRDFGLYSNQLENANFVGAVFNRTYEIRDLCLILV